MIRFQDGWYLLIAIAILGGSSALVIGFPASQAALAVASMGIIIAGLIGVVTFTIATIRAGSSRTHISG